MSSDDIWYGFLQAGDKSSPVVRDPALETNSPKTVYLFNYCRGEFLQYSREIVEQKLRELNSDDVSLAELDRAYKAARKSFNPPVVGTLREARTARTKAAAERNLVSNYSVDELDAVIPGDEGDVIEDDAYS